MRRKLVRTTRGGPQPRVGTCDLEGHHRDRSLTGHRPASGTRTRGEPAPDDLSNYHTRLGDHSVCPYGSVSLHPRHEDRPRKPELKDSEERLPIRPLESGASAAYSRIVGFGGAFGHPAAGHQRAERRVKCVILIGSGRRPCTGLRFSPPDPSKSRRKPRDRAGLRSIQTNLHAESPAPARINMLRLRTQSNKPLHGFLDEEAEKHPPFVRERDDDFTR